MSSEKIAFALVSLLKVEIIGKSLPWETKKTNKPKRYGKKGSLDSQSEEISQYLLTQGQILKGAVHLQLPLKSKGNEEAQHF